MTPLPSTAEGKEGQTSGTQNVSITSDEPEPTGHSWLGRHLAQHPGRAARTRRRSVDTELTVRAQWCSLELCNRVAMGLHNALVQMSQ